MRILVTGGAGFIGSNFIRHLLAESSDYHVINLDALTYAGNLENLAGVEDDDRYLFVRGDITEPSDVEECFEKPVDYLVHFAAESHVDRSIEDSSAFVRTNVIGTQVLLEAARMHQVGRFVHVSTDEVYGSLGPSGLFTEETPLAPNSPYAASKASSDLLVRAYFKTYGQDTVVTRCSNNYGPYQFPEKLIPLMILRALEDKSLPVYGDGKNVRDWIHVADHCCALEKVMLNGEAGRVYNIGGNCEVENLEVVHRILAELGKTDEFIRFVEDRPGHDRRYAIDSSRIQSELGWNPASNFREGLGSTVRWYQKNGQWVSNVQSGDYALYYQRMYDERKATLESILGETDGSSTRNP